VDLYSAYRQYNSTTKRSDVNHAELPANKPHLPFLRIGPKHLLEGDTAANGVTHLMYRKLWEKPKDVFENTRTQSKIYHQNKYNSTF